VETITFQAVSGGFLAAWLIFGLSTILLPVYFVLGRMDLVPSSPDMNVISGLLVALIGYPAIVFITCYAFYGAPVELQASTRMLRFNYLFPRPAREFPVTDIERIDLVWRWDADREGDAYVFWLLELPQVAKPFISQGSEVKDKAALVAIGRRIAEASGIAVKYLQCPDSHCLHRDERSEDWMLDPREDGLPRWSLDGKPQQPQSHRH
jgi:hypothetical protein